MTIPEVTKSKQNLAGKDAEHRQAEANPDNISI
jgi:hypothetical protein